GRRGRTGMTDQPTGQPPDHDRQQQPPEQPPGTGFHDIPVPAGGGRLNVVGPAGDSRRPPRVPDGRPGIDLSDRATGRPSDPRARDQVAGLLDATSPGLGPLVRGQQERLHGSPEQPVGAAERNAVRQAGVDAFKELYRTGTGEPNPVRHDAAPPAPRSDTRPDARPEQAGADPPAPPRDHQDSTSAASPERRDARSGDRWYRQELDANPDSTLSQVSTDNRTFRLGTFAIGSAELNAQQKAALSAFAAQWMQRGWTSASLDLTGHASNSVRTGPESPESLGQRRAEAVRDYLRAEGVTSHITVGSGGTDDPLNPMNQPDSTPETKAHSRSVDIAMKSGPLPAIEQDPDVPSVRQATDEEKLQELASGVRRTIEIVVDLDEAARGDPRRLVDAAEKLTAWAGEYQDRYAGSKDKNEVRNDYLNGMAEAFNRMPRPTDDSAHMIRRSLPENPPRIGNLVSNVPRSTDPDRADLSLARASGAYDVNRFLSGLSPEQYKAVYDQQQQLVKQLHRANIVSRVTGNN
ncbi:MAG: OmpA family protein, partial [Natronosporangium sp.]